MCPALHSDVLHHVECLRWPRVRPPRVLPPPRATLRCGKAQRYISLTRHPGDCKWKDLGRLPDTTNPRSQQMAALGSSIHFHQCLRHGPACSHCSIHPMPACPSSLDAINDQEWHWSLWESYPTKQLCDCRCWYVAPAFSCINDILTADARLLRLP